jgi:hypothetical protein
MVTKEAECHAYLVVSSNPLGRYSPNKTKILYIRETLRAVDSF